MSDKVIVKVKCGEQKETILLNGKRRMFDSQEAAEKAIIEHSKKNFVKLNCGDLSTETEINATRSIVEYKILKSSEVLAQLK